MYSFISQSIRAVLIRVSAIIGNTIYDCYDRIFKVACIICR